MFTKILPHPILSLVLWLSWLLLNNSFDPGHIVLGLILAIFIPWFTGRFWQEKVCLKNPLVLFKFFGVVMWDILIANITVAKLILGKNDKLQPAFFYIDLDVKHPLAISILANTISLTPGTVSCDLTADRKRLLIHALHAEDIDQIIADIKQRYEAPLKEVFTIC
ncbi:Na+/H+ antiporter subunit E [Thiomicrospira microaerophila]|uniref:Na+/H+ antiporter subunit E n=1 Tax=Thiomicrospira microaerophila TaxID=406020 RepID=UPI00200D2B1B|nr:Na+/H+ antiporter subunit E [Thiomicrospira microaerophila]UQB42488.1 Na+/H+ antiporter subunit E [Thiomicrospira microaerophila]